MRGVQMQHIICSFIFRNWHTDSTVGPLESRDELVSVAALQRAIAELKLLPEII